MTYYKNSRKMILKKELLEDKKFNYRLYALLQLVSNWSKGEKHRYIFKKNFNVSYYSKILKISRNKVYRDFKYMLDKKIIERKKESYNLVFIDDKYTLIQAELLEQLVNSKIKNLVRVYCILHNFANYNKESYYTKQSLLIAMGYKITRYKGTCKEHIEASTNPRDWLNINAAIQYLIHNKLMIIREEFTQKNGVIIKKTYFKLVQFGVLKVIDAM